MERLDALDRRILFELDHDSRQSLSSLARKVKQGRDRVDYRFQRLLDRKIIQRCFTYIDLNKLGLTLYKSYLRLENNKAKVAEFIKYLRNHPRIFWVALCDGGWDLIIIIIAKTPREFYDIHSAILSAYNEVVLNFTAYTIVEYKIHSRNYFLKAPRIRTILGGSTQRYEIDRTDFDILKLLAHDSRISALDIAQRVKLTAVAVGNRIERLEKLGIIIGYHLALNLGALGLDLFKVQFFLRNYKLALREQFIEYCYSNPNVIFYIEQVGDCNVELELEVLGYREYSRIIDEIRGQFATLIRNFNTVLIREHWYTPMPADFLGWGLQLEEGSKAS